jgi:hypothetical protein
MKRRTIMQSQPTTEPTRQKIRVKRRGHSTGSEPAQSEALPPCDELQARIAKRAYQLYLERGVDHGYALDDWLQAEREILGPECTA